MTKKINKSKQINSNIEQEQVYSENTNMPDVANMDDLSYAADSDIDDRYRYLLNGKEAMGQNDSVRIKWEEELSYLQRESKIRASRRFAHESYLRDHPEESNYSDDQIN